MADAPRFNSWLHRYLIVVGVLCTLVGYFAPWVNHPAAGLAILGLDLGEYVKFLVPVRDGSIWVWREGFYLPLFVVSLALSLFAFRSELQWALWLRIIALAAAIVAALNMLPPAWTPALLRTPEFRLQSLWIALALAAVLVSPLLALLPRWIAQSVVAAGALASLILCTLMFFALLPAIESLYNHPIAAALGLWLTCAGLILLASGALIVGRAQSSGIEVGMLTEERASQPIP